MTSTTAAGADTAAQVQTHTEVGRSSPSASSGKRTMRKPNVERIALLAGLGVEGDAHLGVTVKHRSRVARDPSQPNLRQVHLVHAELLDELAPAGFDLRGAGTDRGERRHARD